MILDAQKFGKITFILHVTFGIHMELMIEIAGA